MEVLFHEGERSIYTRIKALVSELRSNIRKLRSDIKKLSNLAIEDYINRQLRENPRYQNPKRLNRYEYQVYSQNGEDGIIAEIFRRIGTKNKFFVEFGVGDGLENNTVYLLLKSWTGYWIEGNKKYVKRITQKFNFLINQKRLLSKTRICYRRKHRGLIRKGQRTERV